MTISKKDKSNIEIIANNIREYYPNYSYKEVLKLAKKDYLSLQKRTND